MRESSPNKIHLYITFENYDMVYDKTNFLNGYITDNELVDQKPKSGQGPKMHTYVLW